MSDEQLDEIILLRSSLLHEEFSWRGTASECQNWEAATRQRESNESADALAHTREDTPQSAIAFALKLSGPKDAADLWLNVELPPAYSSGNGTGDAIVALTGPSCPRSFLDSAGKVAQARLRESKEEGIEHRVFDVFTVLQAYITDNPLPEASAVNENAASQRQLTVPSTLRMARVIFWSHHLKAPSKRKDMAAWTSELLIWGLLRPGYPGFLIFEGGADEVDVIVKRIKSLQWHALSVRSHVQYDFKVPTNVNTVAEARRASLLACPLSKSHAGLEGVAGSAGGSEGKARTACEEIENLGSLVERLRQAGIDEEEVVDGLNLRTSS